jgi:hypothetical protein
MLETLWNGLKELASDKMNWAYLAAILLVIWIIL